MKQQQTYRQYADWLLSVLVAVHPEPRWIYQAIEPICGRALQRKEEARQLQRTIAPLGEALSGGLGVPGLKAGLRLLGYDHGDPRPPLPPLAASELPALRRLMEDAKLMPRALAS